MPEFVKAIGAARFGVMAGVAAALTAFFLYIAGAHHRAAQDHPVFRPGTARRRRRHRQAGRMNVKYEAKGDGGTILVPADQVTKLRMAAGAGQPARRRRRL